MKKIFLYLFIIGFFASCDKPYVDCEYPDYSNCITQEPDNGKLRINLTINTENEAVPLTIYYGRVEHEAICLTDTAYVKEKEYIVPADVYYSVKATYKSNGKIVNAIDGGFLEKKSYKVCDSICWVVKDIDLNLKLKY